MIDIYKLVLMVLFLGLSSQAQLLNQRHWRNSEKDSLEKCLQLIDENKAVQAFPYILAIYHRHGNEDYLKYMYAKCALNINDKLPEAFKKLNEIFEKHPDTPDIHLYLAQASFRLTQFDEAIFHIGTYLNQTHLTPALTDKANDLKQRILFAKYYYSQPGPSVVSNLGAPFNDEGNQIYPVINLQASHLYFTEAYPSSSKLISQNLIQQLGQTKYSKSIDEEFKKPELFKFNQDNDHARIAYLSPDGTKMLLIKDNCGQTDIFISYLLGEKFSKPKRLKGPVNSMYNENSCSLSPDGRTLFFSSNRSGGYGGYDLYCAQLSDDSVWTQVQNLGSQINSVLNEDAPFVHANGKTLFFSSEGFDSMGGFDVFKSEFRINDFTFNKAENLKCPINSIADDIGLVISANTEEAFLCSDRLGGKGQMDLYKVKLKLENVEPLFCLLKGKVELNSQAVVAKLSVEDAATHQAITENYSNGTDGTFTIILGLNKAYVVNVWLRNFELKSFELNVSETNSFVEKYERISFNSLTDSLFMTAKASSLSMSREAQAIKSKGTDHKKINQSKKQTGVAKSKEIASNESLFHFQTFATHGNSIGMFQSSNKNEKSVEEMSKAQAKQATSSEENEKGISLIKHLTQVTDSAELRDRQDFMAWFAEGQASEVKDDFVPTTEALKKIQACNLKNGRVKKEGLVFKIQVAANKENSHKRFSKLKHLGAIEAMDFHDDFIRYTIGGEFKTYAEAFELGKKVIAAGHSGIYIFGVKDGKRYKVEDLIEEGIFN